MWTQVIILLCLKIIFADIPIDENYSYEEEEAKEWMEKYNRQAQIVTTKKAEAEWNFAIDMNEDHEREKEELEKEHAKFTKKKVLEARKFDYKQFKNETLKRLFEMVVILHDKGLQVSDFIKLHQVVNNMEEIFSTATVCDINDNYCNLTYNQDLEPIFAKSRDYKLLEHAWTKFRDATGKKMRDLYKVYVELGNKAAKLDNFTDLGAYWRNPYASETFPEDMDHLYKQMEHLYLELHAYARGKLDEQYKGKASIKGTIKAHLLGNMWAQTWLDIFDILKPYEKPSVDVTQKIQEMSVKKMIKIAEEFFTSLGLEKMTPEFWEKSVFEKPPNRNMICHASAWDFRNGKDFRIKMCAHKTMREFITIHHEMGHIQYYMQYKDLHLLFQDGANPGFHEAVGDTLALSVQTPKHLMEKGLLDNIVEDKEVDINYLMMTALDKIAFIPFAYLVDMWRWNVFNGSYSEKEWNKKWWQLRCKYQGIIPPVPRSETDFDPGSKYHVAGDTPYIRYFVSYILQFQFYQSLCKAANYSGKDSFKCDFYRSKEAGRKLSFGLLFLATEKC